ncbi:hypothetical protein DEJ50_12260 [Streptomyces venezuelae]|uniref:AG1 protein n=1 Tax=Streptomyces venezuelae TaxID=54571 RepID=A0A5P2D002_STRVZ|nr:hypothetical protein [Streptomyces venezuelae]QES48476.1 hypothetical protein DEJ50_12260 [Streptomyces venezuelae]
MSFDEEWSTARAAAAANVGTRLNQLPADPGGAGGGNEDLLLNQDHIGAIGHDAHVLHSRLSRDGAHAKTATAEAGTQLKGEAFASGAALLTAQERWDSQLKTLLAGCAHISNSLNYSVNSMGKQDAQIHAAFTQSKVDEYLK